MSSFQAFGPQQGRQFAEQCDLLLTQHGFTLGGRLLVPGVGVEIDQQATSASGEPVWFEYKGSVQGTRPGLLRTDTLKKAIANGALLAAVDDHPPYVVLTSHVPTGGAGLEMLHSALALGYLTDVICIYDPAQLPRLRTLGRAAAPDRGARPVDPAPIDPPVRAQGSLLD